MLFPTRFSLPVLVEQVKHGTEDWVVLFPFTVRMLFSIQKHVGITRAVGENSGWIWRLHECHLCFVIKVRHRIYLGFFILKSLSALTLGPHNGPDPARIQLTDEIAAELAEGLARNTALRSLTLRADRWRPSGAVNRGFSGPNKSPPGRRSPVAGRPRSM